MNNENQVDTSQLDLLLKFLESKEEHLYRSRSHLYTWLKYAVEECREYIKKINENNKKDEKPVNINYSLNDF